MTVRPTLRRTGTVRPGPTFTLHGPLLNRFRKLARHLQRLIPYKRRPAMTEPIRSRPCLQHRKPRGEHNEDNG